MVVGWYKIFQVVLIDGSDGFVRGIYGPEHRRLYGPVGKNVKVANNGRYLRRHADGAAEE